MIPITRPYLPDFSKVKDKIELAMKTGMLSTCKNAEEFEKKAAEYLGVRHCISCSSGSIGLILALSTLPKGSAVIMPSFTFAATYAAAEWNGLKTVFVDCDDYCNIDPEKVEEAITKDTSAILGVHMFGNPCDIKKLESIAKKHKVDLFFDSAHAFGSRYFGKPIGGFGKGEIFSLGITKVFAVGEGGLITTNDDSFAEHVRLAMNNGRGTGSINPTVLGLSGRFQEFNAIIGLELLKDIDDVVKKRNALVKKFQSRLAGIKGISFAEVMPSCVSTFKDFAIFIDEKEFGMSRDELFDRLYKKGIQAKKYFWPPVHETELCKKQYNDLDLPNTSRLSNTTVSLPFYTTMPESEMDYMVDAIKEIQQS